MSKVKISLYIENELYNSYELYNTIKIGQFIKNIIDNMPNNEDYDLFNTKLIYNNIILEHSKTFDFYVDFQFKKDDIYKLHLHIKKNRIRTNSSSTNINQSINDPSIIKIPTINDLQINNQNISKSLPCELDNSITKKRNHINDDKYLNKIDKIDLYIRIQYLEEQISELNKKYETLLKKGT